MLEEAIECLQGKGEKRLMEVSKVLACYMLLAAKKAVNVEAAMELVEESIQSGKALECMKAFVAAQHGDTTYIDNMDKYDKASFTRTIYGKDLFAANRDTADWKNAYLTACNNQEIGMTSLVLGGGRETKESVIDLSVGIKLDKHLGDTLCETDVVATLYGNDEQKLDTAYNRFVKAYTLSAENTFSNQIVYEVITKADI